MGQDMKPNSLVIDSTLAEALKDCQVGDVKDITLKIVVDGMDDGLMGTIKEVVGYEKPKKPAAAPAKKPKRAPALTEAIGDEDEGMGY
jgi:uncharacterized protein YjbJ (UPF0337 family)